MGTLRIKTLTNNLQAAAAIAGGIGKGPGTSRKPVLVYGYDVAPRAAAFAADCQAYSWNSYDGGTEKLESGDLVADSGTAIYTSDFSAGAQGWVDLGGGGPTISYNATVAGETDCLKILGAGGDAASFKKPTTTTNLVMTKMVFDYYIDGTSGLAFIGLGDDADEWLVGYDHDSGWHPAVVEGQWIRNCTLYGVADGTDLELCFFTAINGNTRDTLLDGKAIYLKNIVVTPVSNNTDWTRSADADFTWDFANEVLDCDAGAGGTATYAGVNPGLRIGGIYTWSAKISSYVSDGMNLSAGGITGADLTANGIWTQSIIATAVTGFVATADATGDGDVGDLSLVQHRMNNGADFVLTDATHHTTFRSAETSIQKVKFPKPMVCPEGFFLYLTSGGASCSLDVNIYYEYM